MGQGSLRLLEAQRAHIAECGLLEATEGVPGGGCCCRRRGLLLHCANGLPHPNPCSGVAPHSEPPPSAAVKQGGWLLLLQQMCQELLLLLYQVLLLELLELGGKLRVYGMRCL